ncbi:hypothetical protein [Bathymodiolus thermophilus thioautotrophic gill symbiont]|jgi:hypothetical protein|uniref:Uncharacterized protein n=1 Tax=Bathymodiolus thermophilus thioautotrophic gill symbiont TaxID=2360 RepID=A0A1J5TXS2_9GAMM|nr:hypothetical protein [Bathymodiolus thermophilus thioautotrophic gill symbiont]AYQ57632.1 hypothetical protein MS2017_1972 [Bathymodiolus thermophilus thioautotrophic gill symbiont]OIR25020.1 hypothetical protein BGC33_12410 [Bathymodiolus thermophilus thioautotrophic gill symbiont]
MAKKPHKLPTYNQDYDIVLQAITTRLPIAYCKWSTVNNIDPANYTAILDSVIKGFEKYTLENFEYIYTETKAKITDYINTFEVAPQGSIDEFKLIFFLSRTLSENLENKGLKVISEVVLTAMIWLLDLRLDSVKCRREALSTQIIKMIHRNGIAKETGKVGLYLTYKCLYNSAKDN